jgi:hypothetical protein
MVAPQTQSSILKSAIQVAWIDRNNHSSSNGRSVGKKHVGIGDFHRTEQNRSVFTRIGT